MIITVLPSTEFGISVSIIQPAYVKTSFFENNQWGALSNEKLSIEEQDALSVLYASFLTPHKLSIKERDMKHASDPMVTSAAIHHALTR